MEARYFLYINGVEHLIDEPIGIDDFSDKLVRDPSAHGVAFNYSESELKFTDVAYSLIKNEYDLNGVSAMIFFKAEIKCKDSDDWAEFYYGQLDMSTYDDVTDKYNYIAINPAQQGVELTIKNRQEQEVDLHSLVSFDGKSLSSYPMLEKDITLRGQSVLLTSRGEGIEDQPYQSVFADYTRRNIIAEHCDGNYYFTNSHNGILLISPLNSTLSEIGVVNNFGFTTEKNLSNIFEVGSIFNYLPDANLEINDIEIDIYFKMTFTPTNIGNLFKQTLGLRIRNPKLYIDGIDPIDLNLISGFYDGGFGYRSAVYSCESDNEKTVEFGVTINTLTHPNILNTIQNKQLAVGIEYYLDVKVNDGTQVFDEAIEFKCKLEEPSYFQIKALSYFDDTTSKASLIHETASRIIESITDGKLAVKSDTFKRTDSNVKHQLTNVSLAGTPSVNSGNTALMNGYQIRKSTLSNGLPSYLSMSWKTLIESLTAIYNLGFGVEYDSVNGDVLRLEEWIYFYKSDVIFEINNAPKKRSVNNDELFGTFEGGYNTWETEEFNGQDAFLTGRKYRTDTNITDKTLSKTCKFIADGYAIEATRRKQIDKTTKDYKYDEKQFIVRLVNNGGVYESEKGMTSGDNLTEPTSVYNSSISPARNMMRWANRFLQIIPVGKSKVVKFLSGTGNYFAKGISINSQITAGKLIAENQDITESDYAASSITPLLKPELITLEYPVSLQEWKDIKENPLGVILVDGEKTYIKEVKYNFIKGKASFSLIPKYIQ